MSTFSGYVPEFPDIRIDRFREPALAYFLSHVHSDHLIGLDSCRSPFIYCSSATREILLRLEKYAHRINFAQGVLEERKRTYRHLKNLLKPLPLETPVNIELSPGRFVRVTLFDANHCVGAVMFLIEGSGKGILYTGDLRIEDWWLSALRRHPLMLPYIHTRGKGQLKRLDTIYLDTSFGSTDDMYKDFLSKSQGLQELLFKVSKYPPDTLFYFDTWTFGYEDVWQALSAFLRTDVHVDDYRYGLYEALYHGDGPRSSEAFKLVGTPVANNFQRGCLTKQDSRLHSCERGTECSIWDKDHVRITPIISRYQGVDIHEIGTGGGMGDLNQQHELMLDGVDTVERLIALCSIELEQQPEVREKVLVRLQTASKNQQFNIQLGRDLLTSVISASQFDDNPTIDRTISKLLEKLVASDQIESNNDHIHPVISLPTRITFPYSRHSSYSELASLIEAFLPANIYPCTVDEDAWKPAMSMSYLFGHLYSIGMVFSHDQEMLHKYKQKQQQNNTDGRAVPDMRSASPVEQISAIPPSQKRRGSDPVTFSPKRPRNVSVEPGDENSQSPVMPTIEVSIDKGDDGQTSLHSSSGDHERTASTTSSRVLDSYTRARLRQEAYEAALGKNGSSWWNIELVSVAQHHREEDEKQL